MLIPRIIKEKTFPEISTRVLNLNSILLKVVYKHAYLQHL